MTKSKSGRPSSYTEKRADEICELIAEGKSIRQVCSIDGYPKWPTISRWLKDKEEFRIRYARAREDAAHLFADKITDIAAEVIEGKIKPDSARVAMDCYKWAAGKHAPKVYGDKLQTEVTGPGGGAVVINVVKRA